MQRESTNISGFNITAVNGLPATLLADTFKPSPPEGRYDISVVSADGKVKYRSTFPNLITSAGLDLIGFSQYISLAYLSGGNATPSVTDTSALFTSRPNILTTAVSKAAQSGTSLDGSYYTDNTLQLTIPAGVALTRISDAGIASIQPPVPTVTASFTPRNGDIAPIVNVSGTNKPFWTTRLLIYDPYGGPVPLMFEYKTTQTGAWAATPFSLSANPSGPPPPAPKQYPAGTYVAVLQYYGPVLSNYVLKPVGSPVSTPYLNITSPPALFSRALVKDMTGGAAMITLQPSDSLKVQYSLRTHVPNNDLQGTLLIGGESYRWASRAANALTPSNWAIGRIGNESERVGIMYGATATAFAAPATLGPQTGSLTGAAQSALSSPTTNLYQLGSHQLTGSVNMAQNEANFASGVGGFLVQSPYGGAFQVVFDKGIPKDNTQSLSFDYSVSWA